MPDDNIKLVKNNVASNQSGDNMEDAIRQMNIHDNQEQGGMSQSSQYPDRPGEPDCGYYLRTGMCGYGSNCRFNHPTYAAQAVHLREELPERVGQPDCGYYLKTGTCKYGSTCKYHHPKDRNGAGPVSFNVMGLPMRQNEKPCPYYMQNGSCKFGVACKFHHPQPAAGASIPLNGPLAFGSVGSSIMSSSSVPYVGGHPAWSFPRALNSSGPRLQGPQAYMPFVFSPSQGVVPAQGWNTYMGNLSTVSSSGILGSNLVYNFKNQGESGSSGQVQLLSTANPNLPERPNQPECRYFMNTGTCKYGPDCKYHHPREKIAQFASNMIGPLGLPSRPGQAVCSSYNLCGVCKFGPKCRFDHPLPGYPYNYNLSLQPLPVFDPSLIPYAPTAISSENSVSSNFSDRVSIPDDASNKHQNLDTNAKVSDDPPEQDGSPPPDSSRASSEPSHE